VTAFHYAEERSGRDRGGGYRNEIQSDPVSGTPVDELGGVVSARRDKSVPAFDVDDAMTWRNRPGGTGIGRTLPVGPSSVTLYLSIERVAIRMDSRSALMRFSMLTTASAMRSRGSPPSGR
jgi:hypothetical protein